VVKKGRGRELRPEPYFLRPWKVSARDVSYFLGTVNLKRV